MEDLWATHWVIVPTRVHVVVVRLTILLLLKICFMSFIFVNTLAPSELSDRSLIWTG